MLVYGYLVPHVMHDGLVTPGQIIFTPKIGFTGKQGDTLLLRG